MTAANAESSPRATSESGFTLLEVLLSLAIGLILLVPVGAWMILAMGQHGPTASRFSESAQTRIANTYLSRDVGSAELVKADGFPTDPGCGDPASGDSVFLFLVDSAANDSGAPLRTVYVTNTEDGMTSVWRRTCRTSDTTVVEEQTRVLRDVRTSPAPAAVCTGTDCRQVTVTATLAAGAELNVRAMRRSTLDAAYLGTAGNFRPSVRIRQVSSSGVRPNYTVKLDGSDSSDIDGSIATWAWSVDGPGSASLAGDTTSELAATFSQLGTYKVTLVVTDNSGDTATATETVTVGNVAPIVAVSVLPVGSKGAVQGGGNEATFTFDANGTIDPEGDTPLGYSWDFGANVDPVSVTGSTASVQFTSAATLGTREVVLTVTDAHGASAVERIAIHLLAPDGSDPEPAQPIEIVTDGEPFGALVSTTHTPARAPRAGTVGPGRQPVTLQFSTATTPPLTWELRRGATVVATSTVSPFVHSFGETDAGDWTIALVPGGGGAELTRDFRLNAAPVAQFTMSGSGSAPTLRSFDPGGSSDEHAIVSWSWNFGFFDNWTSTIRNPDHTFTHPGAYDVVLAVIDDDGATGLKVAQLPIAGTLDPPEAGSFDDNTYAWTAIPGAGKYEVHLTVTPGPGCSSSGPQVYEVAISEEPSIATAYAGCAVTAKHRVFVSGSWGPYSSGVARP